MSDFGNDACFFGNNALFSVEMPGFFGNDVLFLVRMSVVLAIMSFFW